MTRFQILAAFVLISAGSLGSAIADERDYEVEIVVTSYAGITARVDAAILSTTILSSVALGTFAEDSEVAGAVLLGTIGASVLTVPILHAVRGHHGRALGSAAMRHGLGVAGLLAVAALAPPCDGFSCDGGPMLVGLFGGLALGALIDAQVMTFEEEYRVVRKTPPPTNTYVPVISARDGGGVIGMSGSF